MALLAVGDSVEATETGEGPKKRRASEVTKTDGPGPGSASAPRVKRAKKAKGEAVQSRGRTRRRFGGRSRDTCYAGSRVTY
ncbi:hypothetical protein C8Q74DRAFT_1232464 [Fomes fomentarius]|nr:hypothetical protein C8Q74DRAFT_1232464 [Fomes fomentarius]